MKWPEVAVGAIILNDKEEMLLISAPKWKGTFVVPGGHVESGETLHDAMVREIMEETGLAVKVCDFLEVQEHVFSEKVNKDKHFIFVDYLCRAKNSDVRLDNHEATEHIWIRPEDALSLPNLGNATRTLVSKYLEKKKSGYIDSFRKLYDIEKQLRKECPWDREQTIESMKKDFLEESKEVLDAIDKKDYANLKEEMGDVLQTMLLMIAIAEEEKLFDLKGVIDQVAEKMVRRHPHVFGGLKGKKLTKEEVLANWKKIKEEEKK